ncbi:membrane integrity-associated transporter subunit PqiC [Kangiella sp. HD9-110m-PIT-SAG06]|nr:membrane integrity-associated transporter subunit PqiC [Kangiella sp. HD9-110m-PIT-SAG06]RDX38135.1 membrane integrity-associated transporter subunit PqiC [Kangiella sp. HD9-110m-PIT-SAG07]
MRYVLITFIIAASLLVSGCSTRSPNSNFYLLENELSKTERTGSLRIGLGPVTVADYLQKPQIAIRTKTSQIKFSEFDRWASDLRGLIISSLQHDLANQLDTDNVFEYPWRRSDNIDYVVQLDIKRFDASFDESSAYLEAKMVLTSREGQSMARSFAITESLSDNSYAAAVSAERRLLEQLGQQIAAIIKQR